MKALRAATVGLLLCMTTSYAGASLVGDTVNVSSVNPSQPLYEATRSVTVEAGTADTQSFDIGPIMGTVATVNVEPASIRFMFVVGPHVLIWGSGAGFTISDIQFLDPASVITGVSVDTDLSGFLPSRVSFTPDTVTVNMSGVVTAGMPTLNLDLQFQPVPEPGVPSLIGIALAGLGFGRRTASKRALNIHRTETSSAIA